ncbi:hypothetical protein [Acinetobacter sp. BSP-28]|uniref:hypothetical protein n=1 Tax=Acinetobacter sp. BSP-28 TaxID=3344661 RepID=UPI00376F8D86
MKNTANFHMLQQVYNFIAERPEFKTKGELDLMLDFFSVIHEDDQKGIRLDSPSKIIGKFGSRHIVNIQLAPSPRNKNEFLTWVYKQLHR